DDHGCGARAGQARGAPAGRRRARHTINPPTRMAMNDWLHNLPVPWLALVVLGITYLIAGLIYLIVMALAAGERARWFKGFSPGMLPPLGILFALLAAFVASQVWSDFEHANVAVQREASELRAVVLLTSAFPPETRAHLQALVARHIENTVT